MAEKFEVTLKSETYPVTGDERIVELSPEQEVWIREELKAGRTVPLYLTTMAKKKYGDCLIGEIIGIHRVK